MTVRLSWGLEPDRVVPFVGHLAVALRGIGSARALFLPWDPDLRNWVLASLAMPNERSV